MAQQQKSSKRRSLRSALKHKKLADTILDQLLDVQTKFNETMDKLDSDDTASLDDNYASTGAVAEQSEITTVADIVAVAEITNIDPVADVSDSLDGTFFTMQDTAGSVAFWIDTDDSGTTIPAGASAADRAIEITTIVTDDTAATIQGLLVTAIDADGQFSAASGAGNSVDVTDAVAEARTDSADGDTGFTITEGTAGVTAALLDGTFFEMNDVDGSVGFWIDTDDSGTTIPAGASALDRAVEITGIASGDSANDVATAVRAIINGDSKFTAPAPGANIIVATHVDLGDLTDSSDGDTGFAFATISQGSDSGRTVTSLLLSDAEGSEAQHKSSFRRTLRSALSHKKLADELLDSLSELQTTQNALLTKLDAEAGTLNDIDYESTLGITAVDSDAEGSEAQHKSSFRRSMRSALSHKKLANDILDATTGLQAAMNDALIQLDVDAGAGTGALTGLYTPFKVTAIDPDSE